MLYFKTLVSTTGSITNIYSVADNSARHYLSNAVYTCIPVSKPDWCMTTRAPLALLCDLHQAWRIIYLRFNFRLWKAKAVSDVTATFHIDFCLLFVCAVNKLLSLSLPLLHPTASTVDGPGLQSYQVPVTAQK